MRNIFKAIKRYHSLFGVRGVAVWFLTKVSGKPQLVSKSVPELKHPIWLRIGATDPAVYRQVFVEQQYDVSVPIVPKVIVDAGANIGLSAVFFANKFPGGTIVAIEPADSNFQVLLKNIQAYPQIKAVKAALWWEEGQIRLFDPGEGAHAFRTEKAGGGGEEMGSVRAVTIASLLRDMNLSHIDILKIDIEGSEKEVFENSAEWIGKVEIVMAELHDHLKKGCSTALLSSVGGFAGPISKGETTVYMRPAPVRA